MIVTVFRTCIICKGDVLCMPDTLLPMCSDHSDTDKLKALSWLENEINKVREKINGRN